MYKKEDQLFAIPWSEWNWKTTILRKNVLGPIFSLNRAFGVQWDKVSTCQDTVICWPYNKIFLKKIEYSANSDCTWLKVTDGKRRWWKVVSHSPSIQLGGSLSHPSSLSALLVDRALAALQQWDTTADCSLPLQKGQYYHSLWQHVYGREAKTACE